MYDLEKDFNYDSFIKDMRSDTLDVKNYKMSKFIMIASLMCDNTKEEKKEEVLKIYENIFKDIFISCLYDTRGKIDVSNLLKIIKEDKSLLMHESTNFSVGGKSYISSSLSNFLFNKDLLIYVFDLIKNNNELNENEKIINLILLTNWFDSYFIRSASEGQEDEIFKILIKKLYETYPLLKNFENIVSLMYMLILKEKKIRNIFLYIFPSYYRYNNRFADCLDKKPKSMYYEYKILIKILFKNLDKEQIEFLVDTEIIGKNVIENLSEVFDFACKYTPTIDTYNKKLEENILYLLKIFTEKKCNLKKNRKSIVRLIENLEINKNCFENQLSKKYIEYLDNNSHNKVALNIKTEMLVSGLNTI